MPTLRRFAWGLSLLGMVATNGAYSRMLVLDEPEDLTELSLEELMQKTVTSVSRKPQRLSRAAAAVFVITAEDIRRSGALSIAEALRLAPGLEVARINANQWAITSRGFNNRLANKMLVLMDGRTVYTPLFSGVYWEVQDTLLEDIDRIEVIRGPGAALWGSNAVNGVINIITKSARDTQGGLLTVGGGTEERGFGAVRYGAQWGEDFQARAYVKSWRRDGQVDPTGRDTPDDSQSTQAGFRLDGALSNQDAITVQGDIYQGDADQTLTFSTLTPPYTTTFAEQADFSGGNLQARWRHAFSATSELEAQIYYDRMERDEATGRQTQDTFDFDLQHRLAWSEDQDIIWGLGYRFTQDRIRNSPYVGLIPDHRDLNLFSAFIHDEIKLEEQLFLTLGARFEHNDYTGFEIQPNARLAWTPDDRHTIWGAISRAVRTPSRADADLYNDLSVIPPNTPANPQPFPVLVTVNGNPAILSESLIAYELGYRFNPHPRFSLDLAGFFNVYDDLRTVREDQPYFEVAPPSHLVLPLTFVNQMSGHTYGLELATDWRPLEKWRLRAAYTYFQANLRLDDGSIDVLSLSAAEGSSPRQQFSLFSTLDLSDRLEFDLWFRSVGALRDPPVDSYATLDVRLGWKPYKDVELAIVGQNLLDSPHLEYGSAFTNSASTEVERGVYVRLDWRF